MINNSNLRKFGSIVGISLQGGKAGGTIKIISRYNCKFQNTGINPNNIARNDLDDLVYPEILSKIEAGKLSAKFRLQRAHIIMYSDESKNKILLNGRTRFRVHIKLKHEYKDGQEIGENDIEDVFGIYPSKHNNPDAAHIMLFKFKGEWLISFDFTYNTGKALRYIEEANNQISEAHLHIKKKEFKLFVHKLSEVFRKITLCILVLNNTKLSFNQNINETNDLFRAYSENGNLDIKYSQHFTKLIGLKNAVETSIRNYLNKEVNESDFLETARELVRDTEQRLKAIRTYRSGPGGLYIEK